MIKGFRGTSLVDYPGKISAVIFFGGCNFRCPFCYNVDLVLPERLKDIPEIGIDEVLAEIQKRKGFISGVVITGGEPTLHPRLLRSLMERIKAEVSLPIKLDTNGSKPEVIKSLLKENLVNFIAIDFKAAPERYPELRGNFAQIEETLSVIAGHVPFEIRITAVPYFISHNELEKLAPFMEGAERVAIQRFMNEYEKLNPEIDLGAYSPEELKSLKVFLEGKVNVPVVLRNV
ncbi:anaerobic ribonucleoside-triphosphate reductase activating protein [Thermodesulfatator autotrophicus]|uniref:Radical SAM protein n=1 Tax=Thermodesulfatator autotrophicus TaxID=1795632 RepID=A0A177E5Q1_9BACT|nr:anaerobic ribonucleoside-triphosphate reductase activating protein [Thermodesulfatator autotrophicus]OAG27046.1 radical SAM protein [Thermodesulfatator autotrophicus]